jgi:hypothetical protein
MALETLDRMLWSYAEALAHVQTVTVARRAIEAAARPAVAPVEYRSWERPRDPASIWKAEAEEQLLVALRDGDLIAQGRLSENRNGCYYGPDTGRAFILHSGHHQHITPPQWREGRLLKGALTATFWEFIDIRLPRFMVRAIWPDFVPTAVPRAAQGGKEAPYTTPYLDLMQAAIAHFGITAASQEKKECLVDWFLAHEVEGELVSKNLAEAMATLIRLPAAQRGGAKRVIGPDLRQAG